MSGSSALLPGCFLLAFALLAFAGAAVCLVLARRGTGRALSPAGPAMPAAAAGGWQQQDVAPPAAQPLQPPPLPPLPPLPASAPDTAAPPQTAPPPSPATAASATPRLVWISGALAGQVVDVPPTGLWIGREAPAQVLIRDAGVSRLHLWVGVQGGDLVAVDEKSSNGTFVDGDKIVRRVLRPGDVVILARATSFRVETGAGG